MATATASVALTRAPDGSTWRSRSCAKAAVSQVCGASPQGVEDVSGGTQEAYVLGGCDQPATLPGAMDAQRARSGPLPASAL